MHFARRFIVSVAAVAPNSAAYDWLIYCIAQTRCWFASLKRDVMVNLRLTCLTAVIERISRSWSFWSPGLLVQKLARSCAPRAFWTEYKAGKKIPLICLVRIFILGILKGVGFESLVAWTLKAHVTRKRLARL